MLHKIYSFCENCVFAKMNENEQVGCELGKLEAYKDIGAKLELADGNNGKKYYKIHERVCVFLRNEELLKDYPKNTWKQIVTDQAKVPYHLVLIFDEGCTLKDLKITINSIKNQTESPSLITIVNKQYIKYSESPNNTIKPSELLSAFYDEEITRVNLTNIYQDLHYREISDFIFDKNKKLHHPFYAYFKVGFDIPKNFGESLTNALFVKMLKVCFAKPIDDINGMIINKQTHNRYNNSFGIYMEDKIEKEEKNSKQLIFEAREICPELIS